MRPTFKFKQFSLSDDKSAMKIGTDAVLLGAWTNVGNAKQILDIGTGCGILALMLAQRSEAGIDAVEIDPASADEAIHNFKLSPWSGRFQVYREDIRLFAEKISKKYDLIISNPPFFSNSLKSPYPVRNISKHDELLKLEEIFRIANHLLNPGGNFSMILPYPNSSWILDPSKNFSLFLTRLVKIYPKPGKECNRILLEFSNIAATKYRESWLEIRDNQGRYTADYKKLTGDYYLKF